MASDIKAGDLVAVVRWPCCGKWLGAIRSVISLHDYGSGPAVLSCTLPGCGGRTDVPSTVIAKVGAMDGELCQVPLTWLKRIPPLDELENTKEEKPHEIQL